MSSFINYRWFFKLKLYHIPLWFAYHFIWWTLRIGSPATVINSIFYSPFAFKFFFYMIFQAIGVYFNLYFLMPRFLEKGRYAPYIVLLLMTIISVSVCIVSGYYIGAFLADRPFQEMYQVDPGNYFYLFESSALPSTLASMTLAMSIKLTRSWIRAKQRENLLEKEKLETELKFLRSQFNPHFLFNTINSIFVLINKNPTMASEALAKFSELLRYQLYECNEPEIPLRQEITYLENFIELEKLRRDTIDLELTVDIQEEFPADLMIAPFVLIPFIENAFKHVSQRKDETNWIRMKASLNKNNLNFTIVNSISQQSSVAREVVQYGGVGLKNVQRRLDLMYAGKHQLNIEKNHDEFTVTLQVELRPDTATERIPGSINYPTGNLDTEFAKIPS